MKANELQIGDYVNYRGQIIKVTSLYDKGGSNEVGWSDKESVWVNADNVEPILITKEILEKNFPKPTDGVIWYSEEGGFSCHTNAFGLFRFVHELQHALRLCGIEKEIML